MAKHPLTPKQLAADRANLAKSRLTHKALTAKQLAADRANLAKARAKLSTASASAVSTTGARRKFYTGPGTAPSYNGRHKPLKVHPLGVRVFTLRPTHKLHKPTITGIVKKVPTRIAPTSFDQVGRWRKSRGHHFRKHLFIRKPRIKRLRSWRRRRHNLHPL